MTDEERAWFDANRAAWNTLTPLHVRSAFYDVPGFLAGADTLNPVEIALVGDVTGKSLLHLQCHFGQDTLSWARRGARVVGVDFSEVAIAEARRLEATLQLGARFVESNVYDYVPDEPFDIVFTSYGTIGWLPDLAPWAATIARSLRPGGRFHLVEFHPYVWMFDTDGRTVRYPYTNAGVITVDEQGSYAARDAEVIVREHGWNHSIGEVVNALVGAGLTIRRLDEHLFSPYPCVPRAVRAPDGAWWSEGAEGKVPLVYALTAER